MRVTVDGNEAAASVAYRLSEVCCIYPITPASPMAELADEWSSRGRPNLWGGVPGVIEMQSEAGAAGALHGAIQGGALGTTFTASQGLLLMIPNMYKIAGELTPAVFHVAARSLATQALSIFGDHSDVMAARQTGLALLCSASVQEAHDMALVAHAATLRSRVPFLHFFDGFRTSHELNTLEEFSDDELRAFVPEELIRAHRARALSPERPFVRGTAHNPDTFFQAREASNPFYARVPQIVQETMDALAERTGRRYGLVDYSGHPEADRAIVVMGSGGETARETARYLQARGERVGVAQLRLYRPFPASELLRALPQTLRRIAVLDRTKEPGSEGEPLFLDVLAALNEAHQTGERESMPRVSGGRFGLSSKEFDPGMAAAVFEELERDEPRRRFTVGIDDDVSHASIPVEADLDIEPPETVRAVFFGLGADGTVGANKNTIKILGEAGLHAQGYFVYDSKKSGSQTISHLRFGPAPICAPYLVSDASFVGCHQFRLLERPEVLERAAPGATLLLNTNLPPDRIWEALSPGVQRQMLEKRIELYAIDAGKIARAAGLAGRVNTVLQTCFFAISGVLPGEQAIEQIKAAIEKSYRRRGQEIVDRNIRAVDSALEGLHRVEFPAEVTSEREERPIVPADAPEFVRTVTAAVCRSARSPSTVPIRAGRRSTRSATSRTRSRSGTRSSASSAATAASFAPTASSAAATTSRRGSRAPRPASSPRRSKAPACRARGSRSRCTSRTARVAGSASRRVPSRPGAIPCTRRSTSPHVSRSSRSSAGTSPSSSSFRRPTVPGSTSGPCGERSSSSRCSSSPAPAPAAARPRTSS
jgi:pyruvate-ferredoxin/flavodoxin oxidoreductase